MNPTYTAKHFITKFSHTHFPKSPSGGFRGLFPKSPLGGFRGRFPKSPSGGFRGLFPKSPSGGFRGRFPKSPSGGFRGLFPKSPSGEFRKLRSGLVGLLLLFSLSTASIFTHNNRYELSYDYINATAQAVATDTVSPLFSAPELITLPQDNHNFVTLRHKDQSITLTPHLSFFSETAEKNSDLFTSFNASTRFTSSFLSAYLDVHAYTTQNQAFNTSNEFAYERFIRSDEHEPISGFTDFRVNLAQAYLETSFKNLTLQTGKRKLRWGPGYKGTLGMSGTNFSPFFFYHLQLAFGELLHLSSFLCTYDDPYYYEDELEVEKTLIVRNNNIVLSGMPPRYGAGQRINIRLGKHLQLGIYELVTFFGAEDLTHFSNPLQLYYLGNQASGSNNANLLGGMDFNLVFDNFRIYGEFLNDDITVFEKSGNPDKFALQLGTAYYPDSRVIAAGLEYTHVSPYVYGHSRVLSRHALWGESLGWPYGNDQDVITGYCIFDLGHTFKARAELNWWLRGEGTIRSDWYADGKPDLEDAPYFPENANQNLSAYLGAQYRPFKWLTGSVVYRPSYEEGNFGNAFQGMVRIGFPGKGFDMRF